jgi:hypothetical protein
VKKMLSTTLERLGETVPLATASGFELMSPTSLLSPTRIFSPFDNDVRQAITQEYYDLFLEPAMAAQLVLGAGVDMRNPYTPRAKPSPFNEMTSSISQALSLEGAKLHSKKVETVEEELKRCSASFKIKYGPFAKAKTFIEEVSRRVETCTIIYLDINIQGGGNPPQQHPVWKSEPLAIESITDPENAVATFIGRYGTHYVEHITHGASITIRIEMKSKEEEKIKRLETAISATKGLWNGGGTFDKSHHTAYKELNVEIDIATLGENIPEKLKYATGIDKVMEALEELRNNTIQLQSGPILAQLHSYIPLLHPNFPNTYQAFNSLVQEDRQKNDNQLRLEIDGYLRRDDFFNTARAILQLDSKDHKQAVIAPLVNSPDIFRLGLALCENEGGYNFVEDFFPTPISHLVRHYKEDKFHIISTQDGDGRGTIYLSHQGHITGGADKAEVGSQPTRFTRWKFEPIEGGKRFYIINDEDGEGRNNTSKYLSHQGNLNPNMDKAEVLDVKSRFAEWTIEPAENGVRFRIANHESGEQRNHPGYLSHQGNLNPNMDKAEVSREKISATLWKIEIAFPAIHLGSANTLFAAGFSGVTTPTLISPSMEITESTEPPAIPSSLEKRSGSPADLPDAKKSRLEERRSMREGDYSPSS